MKKLSKRKIEIAKFMADKMKEILVPAETTAYCTKLSLSDILKFKDKATKPNIPFKAALVVSKVSMGYQSFNVVMIVTDQIMVSALEEGDSFHQHSTAVSEDADILENFKITIIKYGNSEFNKVLTEMTSNDSIYFRLDAYQPPNYMMPPNFSNYTSEYLPNHIYITVAMNEKLEPTQCKINFNHIIADSKAKELINDVLNETTAKWKSMEVIDNGLNIGFLSGPADFAIFAASIKDAIKSQLNRDIKVKLTITI